MVSAKFILPLKLNNIADSAAKTAPSLQSLREKENIPSILEAQSIGHISARKEEKKRNTHFSHHSQENNHFSLKINQS